MESCGLCGALNPIAALTDGNVPDCIFFGGAAGAQMSFATEWPEAMNLPLSVFEAMCDMAAGF